MARCKYSDSVCANMTLLNGVAFCDSVPCSLRDELPKPTNADRIRSMTVEELAAWIAKEILNLEWNSGAFKMAVSGWKEYLQQPAPEEGEQNV